MRTPSESNSTTIAPASDCDRTRSTARPRSRGASDSTTAIETT
ncbi:Uncharacterised protein [Mycobacteroides abscessus]|nr:Uncharacterised protein [Mycobacteroides abscessus]